jgi:hypothetical protein
MGGLSWRMGQRTIVGPRTFKKPSCTFVFAKESLAMRSNSPMTDQSVGPIGPASADPS